MMIRSVSHMPDKFPGDHPAIADVLRGRRASRSSTRRASRSRTCRLPRALYDAASIRTWCWSPTPARGCRGFLA